jgi:endonuclease YncB( thermonuclease family)
MKPKDYRKSSRSGRGKSPRSRRFFLIAIFLLVALSAREIVAEGGWSALQERLQQLWRGGAQSGSQAPAGEGVYGGRVRYVVDGDSIYLQGEERQIRLWGVDAPERDEAGYAAATKSLRKIAAGEFLECVQVDIDRYERIVGRCFIGDKDSGAEVNALQICSGTVEEYKYFSKGFYARQGC